MSLDPEVVSQAISGVGKGIGHILTGAGEGHLIDGVASGMGNLVNELLKGPLQILINLFVICVLIIGVLFVLWKLRHTRCAKKVKNRFSGKKNLTTADRTVQKLEDTHEETELVEEPTKELEETELVEEPTKELEGYQLHFVSQSAK